VISGEEVARVLAGREQHVVDVVEAAYRAHGAGDSVNPPSAFLRFPDRPTARIIALPASLGGDVQVDGIKWIASRPENVAAGLPRASAVLVLNDRSTGYPFACLEASLISAARTAASAALAADRLGGGRGRPRRVGFSGAGLIARHVHAYLRGTGWSFDSVLVHDLSARRAAGFAEGLRERGERAAVRVVGTAEELVRGSDLVVFATVAASPHVRDPGWFAHHPLVLHLSLRDLDPAVVLSAVNVVDDVEHCLTARTSVHLAELRTGGRDFLLGTLDDVLGGRVRVPDDRTVVFSPFGLGVLDLAVGARVYEQVRREGRLRPVEGFFPDPDRHG
jgi:N-[(2S)-2-amino-2-carboxyethyl]-L-glutamate dehydrogenase